MITESLPQLVSRPNRCMAVIAVKGLVANLFFIDFQANGNTTHTKTSTWLPSQGRETCHFGDIIHGILLNTLACYTRRLIQLEKRHNFGRCRIFCARLHNKRAIVREGTGYPSNRGPRGVIVLE